MSSAWTDTCTTFSVEQLRRKYRQAAPVFGLGKEALGECGWVRYEARNLKESVPLPDANMLLTFEANGEKYPPAPYQRPAAASGKRTIPRRRAPDEKSRDAG